MHARSRLTVAAALLLAAAGCGGTKEETGDTGGTMIVVVPAEPDHLFHPAEPSTEAAMVISNIFDKLANAGDDLNTRGDSGFTPALAKSWKWADDSMSIAFTLNEDAHWHDGKPVVAEDVRYSFRTYLSDQLTSAAKPLLSNIDSVSVPDTHTAVFWFKRRTPYQFFDATYHMYILPSHLLAQTTDSLVIGSEFARNPVGSGRFRFVRWEPRQRIEIMADTANYRGRAKLDRVIFSFTEDAGAATIRLFAGEADFYEQIRPEQMPEFNRAQQLKLVDNPTLQYQFIGFNLRNPKDTMRPHPVFGDHAVRRALVLATDRDRITRAVFDSFGSPSIGPVPRALYPDTTTFQRPVFSTERAMALLDSAGWVDNDNDGIREKNGVKLSFELLAPQTSLPRQRAATQLMEQYRRIGVEVKPLVLEGRAIGDRLGKVDFDAYTGGWAPTPGLRGMPGAWSTGGVQNYQHYNNPRFDAALNEALMSFNAAQAKAAFGRALQIIWDDAPSVWLFEPQLPMGMHKRIQHAPIRADGWYVNLADWSVDPAQRIERDRIGLRGNTR